MSHPIFWKTWDATTYINFPKSLLKIGMGIDYFKKSNKYSKLEKLFNYDFNTV